MRVLDLQDFHSLRVRRQEILASKAQDSKLCDLSILQARPDPQDSLLAARELASMYRSDLVITCSDYEQYLLKNYYNIGHTALITFFQTELYDLDRRKKLKTYEKRKNFAWIGNFNHPPNADAADLLVKKIWIKVRERLPKAELHIYGANYKKEFSGLEKLGIGIRSLVSLTTPLLILII